jgi:two-component system sensor histidine kinase/response regulator
MEQARILIVEDDAILAAHLSDTIEKFGYTPVGLAGTAEQAIALASEKFPDAILMDIKLRGEKTGIQAAEEIHKIADIPIIYLTAYTDEILLHEAKTTDAYAFLTKPVRERELRASFEMALYKHATEKQLAYERYLMNTLMDTIPDHIYFKDSDSRFIRMNKELTNRFNLNDPSEAIGKTDFDFFTEDHARPAFEDEQEIIWSGKGIINKEEKETWPDGRVTWVSTTKLPLKDPQGHIIGTFGISRDITEKKKAEEQIIGLNRIYAVLSNINELIVRERNENRLFEETCRIAVDVGKFLMCWIGMLDEQTGLVKPLFSAGKVGNYLQDIRIMVSDTPEGSGPTGTAIRTQQLNICTDIESDERMAPWRDKALAHGFRSTAAFPITVFNKTVGAINIYADKINYFNKLEIELLDELAKDISFALEIIKLEKERKIIEGKNKEQSHLLEVALDAIIVRGIDDTLLFWNKGAEMLYGWKFDEARSLAFHQLICPEYHQLYQCYLKQFLQNGVWEGELSQITKDGRRIITFSKWTMVYDEEGNPTSQLIITRDITARKEIEIALRESEERFRTLYEASPEAIIILDPNCSDPSWPIVDCNELACHLNGYTREELIGQSIDILNIAPGTLQERSDYMERLRREGILRYETFHRHHDGHIFPVEVSTSLVKTKDRELVLGFDRDISERKNMEIQLKKLSQAVEQSPASIVITNTDGAIEYFNPRFTELTGYSLEEASGKNQRILKSGHTSLEEYKQLWNTILSGKEWQGEFLNKKKDGTLYWETALISPIFAENGTITNFLALKEDITEQKQTAEALRESEMRYRRLVEHSPDAIAIHFEGLFVYVNPAAVKLFGVEDESQILGKPFIDLVHSDNKELVRQRILTGLQNGKTASHRRRKICQTGWLHP